MVMSPTVTNNLPALSASTLSPPTSHLPPIKSLLFPSPLNTSLTIQSLSQDLEYLRKIYNPPVRGSKRRRSGTLGQIRQTEDTSTYHASPETTLKTLRLDSFERSYALRWISALIKGIETGVLGQVLSSSLPRKADMTEKDDLANLDFLLHSASALLAVCSGTSAAGTVVREYEFDVNIGLPSSSSLPQSKIHLTLTDIPLSNNNNSISPYSTSLNEDAPLPPSKSDYFASVGSQTWGGAVVLAEEMAARPGVFLPDWLTGIRGRGVGDIQSRVDGQNLAFNVLELGAGTGLVSIAAGKVVNLMLARERFEDHVEEGTVEDEKAADVSRTNTHFNVTIVATDYYPAVLDNLQENVERNFPSSPSPNPHVSSSSAVHVITHPLDWSTFSRNPASPANPTPSSALIPSFALSTSTSSSCARPTSMLPSSDSPDDLEILKGKFDLILGADIIYDSLHATWIRNVVETMLRKPKQSSGTSYSYFPTSFSQSESHSYSHSQSPAHLRSFSIHAYAVDAASASLKDATVVKTDQDDDDNDETYTPTFHLVIPLRKSFASESESVEKVFRQGGLHRRQYRQPFTTGLGSEHKAELESESRELELVIYKKEIIVCDTEATSTVGGGGKEEEVVEYAYYVIGWGVPFSVVS